jgi:hypothetical protein
VKGGLAAALAIFFEVQVLSHDKLIEALAIGRESIENRSGESKTQSRIGQMEL